MSNHNEGDILTAASTAMQMIDKLNDQRFKRMNQINNLFMLTTFYHFGGNLADSCKPDSRNEIKVKDPRFVCVVKQSEQDPQYLYFLDYVLQYKVWQRIPVYDPNSKNTVTGEKCSFYPESFNSILNWLIASLDNYDFETKFRADSHKIKWSNVLASLYYFDKLEAFKQYAIEIFDISENKINAICALPKNSLYPVADVQMFESAVQKLQQLVGLSRLTGMSNHAFVFITEASYCSQALKDEYIAIKKEYDKSVEDIKSILKQSQELTLCWNSASTSPSYIGEATALNGGTNMVYQNIEQVLNCVEEQLKSKTTNMTDEEFLIFARENRSLIEKNNITIEQQNAVLDEIQRRLKILVCVTIAIIIALLILFILLVVIKKRQNFCQNGFL
jgi:hypothetical protein